MHKSESHVPLFRHCTRRKAGSIPSQLCWNLGCINYGGSRGASNSLYFSAPLHHNVIRSESFLYRLDNHHCLRPDQVDAMNATRQSTESGNLLADTTHIQKENIIHPLIDPSNERFFHCFSLLDRPVVIWLVYVMSYFRRVVLLHSSLIKWTVVIDVLQKNKSTLTGTHASGIEFYSNSYHRRK